MKQKIIILEGHDRSGKSHIAEALSLRTNIPLYKAHRNKHWWDPIVNIHYFTEAVTQFLEQTKTSVILDRWMGSDYMYSKLFDRDISFRKIFELDERFAKMNALLVICFKDESCYIEDKEDFEYVNTTMYSKMTALYREYCEQSKIKNILFLNTSDENIENQLKAIISSLI